MENHDHHDRHRFLAPKLYGRVIQDDQGHPTCLLDLLVRNEERGLQPAFGAVVFLSQGLQPFVFSRKKQRGWEPFGCQAMTRLSGFFLRIFESSIFFETKHCQVPFLLSNSMQFSNASHLQIDFAGSVVQRERKVSDSDDVRLCAENENGFSVTFPSVGNIRVDLRGAKDEPSETQSLDEWHVSQVSFHGLRRARFSGRSRPGWSDGQMGRIGRTQKMQMMQMIIRMLRSGRAVEFFFVCPFSTNSVILFVPKCDLHRYASSQ